MVAATGTCPRAKKRSTAATSEDDSGKPRKPRAPRRITKAAAPQPPAPLPLPVAQAIPAPSKWRQRVIECLPVLWFIVTMAVAAG
jgi:hypothetical protein